MSHETSLIATLALSLIAALIGDLAATRLRLPLLVGYLLGGVLIGPFTSRLADARLAHQVAEVGVIQLMFGVGLHVSIRDLLRARALAIPGALLQMASATCLGAALAFCWGWSPGGGLVFGLGLSVASTVVLLRALQAQGALSSEAGPIAVGWLIVEDLLIVLILVLLPAFAGALGGQAPGHAGAPQSAHAGSVLAIVGVTLAKEAAFFAVMLLAGKAITTLALALVFRRTWPTAPTIAASVAQIGEFSFILAGLGLSLRLLPPEGLNLIVAGALFSIALNPLLFGFARTLEQRTRVPAAEGGVASAQT
jgi:monovalent cation:H+ antiporter-2, CPA2 family